MVSMRVLLLGATGVAGRSALRALTAAGHQVTAHARTPDKSELVRRLGAAPVAGDAEDAATLLRWLDGMDAAVDLRVQIPGGARVLLAPAWREYRRLRDEAAGQLVDCAIRAGVPVVVHDTVSMVYADGGDAVLDERAPVEAPGALSANLAAERHLERLTRSGGRGVALRFGQFYGPDDVVSTDTLKRAERGQALVLGHLAGWTSAVHTDDTGPAVVAALEVPGGIYNVVDDDPLRRADLLSLLGELVGRSSLRRPPALVTAMASAPVKALARSQRVSAEQFRRVSGWRPSVGSRRSGWPAVARRVRGVGAP